MALARYTGQVIDEAGNQVDGATITVTNESNGAVSAIFADLEGVTVKANPFVADADGSFFFHATGGTYRIDATKASDTQTLRYVQIGTAAGTDAVTGVTRTHTVAGDVTVGPGDRMVIVKKDTGAATNVNIPAAAARNGVAVIIKDGKGDAASNNITPVFDGSETCDGLTGADLAIKSNYGLLWMEPLPDGTGYVLMPSQL